MTTSSSCNKGTDVPLSASRFSRTTSGKIALYRFYPMPVVWVEGITDYVMFERLLNGRRCVIRQAGGVEECRKLAEAMVTKDLPYIVVMDGDYGILTRRRSFHRRVVFLRRHSIENYAAESPLLELLCQRYCHGAVEDGVFGRQFERLLEEVRNALRDLVVLDVACQEQGYKVLPDSILRFLSRKRPPAFNRTRIEKAINVARQHCVGNDGTGVAEESVDGFVATGRFIDIVKGHWVFELIRWFMIGELKRTGATMRLDDEGLRMLLAPEMWKVKSEDHVTLERSLKRAVREVRKIRAAVRSPGAVDQLS